METVKAGKAKRGGIGWLTAVGAERIKAPGYHADGGGLYLQVAPSGARTWIFRYTRKGPDGRATRPEIGIGSYNALTLAQAREKARECRNQIVNGIDPLHAKREAHDKLRAAVASAITFESAADRYIEAHRAGWKNAKHAQQWENTLAKYAYPKIGKLPVQAVQVPHILEILNPIWTTKTETASRVRNRIELVLDWATARGYREGLNPARWRGHLDKLLPKPDKVAKVEHHPALKASEMGAFMARLRAMQGTAPRALEFTILTAARSGEVRGATWREFDLDAAVWTVPAERMKATKEHRVPLSPRALAVLRAMLPANGEPNPDAFAFPAPRGGALSDMALTAVTRRMEVEAVPHGFRSTFRDWAAEQTNFPREVAEMALAHAISNAVEAAYRRGDLFDKRRRLMNAWADFCARETAPAVVIPIGDSNRTQAAA